MSVAQALAQMQERRLARGKEFDLYGPTRRFELDALRETIFSKRDVGEAFHELEPRKLALLESVVEGYRLDEKLQIVAESDTSLLPDYAVIRHNLLSGEAPISPSEFRMASSRIVALLLEFVKKKFGIPPDTTVVLPWRAALAFANAAYEIGIRHYFHIGASRDETNLETQIYFEEVPTSLKYSSSAAFKKVLVADPMLASGNTVVYIIRRLKDLGVKEENITVVSVISAPEGVDHIISLFPDVRIVVGCHDERLNDRGYIVPGLGDYGDLWFEGLGEHDLSQWSEKGILGKVSLVALLKRMTRIIEVTAAEA